MTHDPDEGGDDFTNAALDFLTTATHHQTERARMPENTTATETDNPWNSARPWLTADNVVIRGDEVLLIQRADEPHKGSWALPGGYADKDESSRMAAARELREETGIWALPSELVQVGAYDDPDRDPRGRVITIAYLLEVASGVAAVAGDDAANADWFLLDKLPQLAFDHAEILTDAIRLRNNSLRRATGLDKYTHPGPCDHN